MTDFDPDRDPAAETALSEQWRALLARHAATACAIDRELGEAYGLGVSEFELLERLREFEQQNPDLGERAQTLAATVHLSQSAFSRLVARLEKAGLVERTHCVDDRRGIFITLTDEGRERYLRARPVHRRILAETLGPEG
ncbi:MULTISPECIES: MarR family transcriptional regulator [Kitasatospora]|uniref:Putative MarR family transcriptional regulator n=1 Tax=Kitasatospora setae (strain ATCC 33774 / DSM 43861 / JCM 3304 / KCC A-0304 / NBRC 14216 / KM-6054) TaxID=452652 RepID=E4N8K2_KITSK|nr:MarR family transcriptional regulator [Kitasatospora setae]BAJ27533.1 putative MarR family transcriptional regulator [Kitasatospora setae KM-6054]